MFNVIVDGPIKTPNLVPAGAIDVDTLFVDSVGSLYLRVLDGAVLLKDYRDWVTPTLIPYSVDELSDFVNYPTLRACIPVAGSVEMRVKIGKSEKPPLGLFT